MKNEVSTAVLVTQHVMRNPYLVDFLSRNLINVSALAREMLPLIQDVNPKATIESVTIAIKRLNLTKNAMQERMFETLQKIQLKMRNNLTLLLVESYPALLDFTVAPDDVYFVNQGADEVTVILDSKNVSLINDNHVRSRLGDLAAISLKGPYRDIVGFVYFFLHTISGDGINIKDMISTQSQFTFIVSQKDAIKVYQLCEQAIRYQSNF